MHFAIQCVLAANVTERRLALRPTHLQYLVAHQDRIFCGGPTLDRSGQPEMMLIIFTAPDLASAEAFMQAEPYNRAGVFESVTISQWLQVLPESEPGELLREIGGDRLPSQRD
jgi:uncharacterized protein